MMITAVTAAREIVCRVILHDFTGAARGARCV